MDIKPEPLLCLDETELKQQEIAASIRLSWEIIKAQLNAPNSSADDEQIALQIIFENFRALEKIWNEKNWFKKFKNQSSTRLEPGAFCEVYVKVILQQTYVQIVVDVEGWTAAAALGTCSLNRKERYTKQILKHGFQPNYRIASRGYSFDRQGPLWPRKNQIYCWKTDIDVDKTLLSPRIQNLIAWSGSKLNLQASCRRVILSSMQQLENIDRLPLSIPFKQILKYEDRDYFLERPFVLKTGNPVENANGR